MAITCDDWVACMEQASNRDLSQFKLWYSQAGTPTIKVKENFVDNKYSITLQQILPPTPESARQTSDVNSVACGRY